MAKANESESKFLEVKIANGKLIFIFGNGEKLTFDPAECNEEINRQATFHGYNQKIRDAAAGYSKDKDYAGAREEMSAVIEALRAGNWKRQGGGMGAGVVMADMAHAIAEMKNVSFERAMAAVEKADEETRKSWAKNPKLAAKMAEAKAKRLAAQAAGTDAGDLDIAGLDETE